MVLVAAATLTVIGFIGSATDTIGDGSFVSAGAMLIGV